MAELKGYFYNNGRTIEERAPKTKRFKDFTGEKVGALEVKEFLGFFKNRQAAWGCICQCGKRVVYGVDALRKVQSCGCLQFGEEATRKRAIGCRKENSAFNSVLNGYKRHAKERGHSWQLSNELFREIVQMPCIYCGSQKKNCQRTKTKIVENDVFYYTGIDRLKNDRGYVPGNIAPCCTACNFAKGERDAKDFQKWIEEVSNYRKENYV